MGILSYSIEKDPGNRKKQPGFHGFRKGPHFFFRGSCVWSLICQSQSRRFGFVAVSCFSIHPAGVLVMGIRPF